MQVYGQFFIFETEVRAKCLQNRTFRINVTFFKPNARIARKVECFFAQFKPGSFSKVWNIHVRVLLKIGSNVVYYVEQIIFSFV